MRVLFYIRANHDKQPGGDLIQLHKTAEALRAKGVDIEYSSDPNADLKSYDLVHTFNSPRFDETKSFFENAIAQNKPVVFSTIFWSKKEMALGISTSPVAKGLRLLFGVKLSTHVWDVVKGLQRRTNGNRDGETERWLFKSADMLLPNSEGEMREIISVYGDVCKKYEVVTNAIDAANFKKEPGAKRDGRVLSVGRVERRKNTLELIEACRILGKHLVLVGAADNEDDYVKVCLKRVNEYGFEHQGNMPQEKLKSYYYSTEVHAMASWYETPGLASMEAACGGCKIVSTDRGSTIEYFGQNAFYCDPFSRSSIVTALDAAFKSKYSTKLRAHILGHNTWQVAAKDTLRGYVEALR